MAQSYTMSDKKLLDILRQQENLFSDPNVNSMGAFAQSELKTKAMRIDAAWKSFFLENPDHIEGLILYGKFLRKIGQSAKAYATFQKANSLDANIGVVKQQLSAIEAEEGSVKEAFAHITQAVNLEDENIVFLKQKAFVMVVGKKTLVGSGVISPSEYDEQLLQCYRKISESTPNDRQAKIRYAQSFYDLFEPNWEKALSIWNEILASSTLNIERQSALANKARVLVELGRDEEATQILKTIDIPSLMRPKNLLLREINASKNRDLKSSLKSERK